MNRYRDSTESGRPQGGQRRRQVDRLLPLRHTWLHIMLAVAGGHRHGYAIRQEVETRTAGKVRLWPTTLYGTLARLAEAGLLEEVEENPDVDDDDPRRRYYRLTDLGVEVLEAETRRLEELVRLARSRGPLGEPGRV